MELQLQTHSLPGVYVFWESSIVSPGCGTMDVAFVQREILQYAARDLIALSVCDSRHSCMLCISQRGMAGQHE